MSITRTGKRGGNRLVDLLDPFDNLLHWRLLDRQV